MRAAAFAVAFCCAAAAAAAPAADPAVAKPFQDFTQIQQTVGRSVVCVHSRTVSDGPKWRQRPTGKGEEAVGSGSGFVVRTVDRGVYIVTNAHVVLKNFGEQRAGAPTRIWEHILVSFPSGEFYDAIVAGFSAEADLAVLRVDCPPVPATKWAADSNAAQIGEWVMAVGFPRGLGYSASIGIVSATERSFGVYPDSAIESFIQTDASINPGNSGGPLINTSGEVLGVNAAILSQSGGSEGLGFAISSNLARRVIDDIIDNGQVRWAGLGVDAIELTPENARECGLPYAPALRAVRVTPNGPAGIVGIPAGAFIRTLNGLKLSSIMQLRSRLAECRIGDTVKIEYVDHGEAKVAAVVLAPLAGTQQQLAVDDLIYLPEINIGVYWSGSAVVVGDVKTGLGYDWGIIPGDVVLVTDARNAPSDMVVLRRDAAIAGRKAQLVIKRNGKVISLPRAR